MAFFVGNYEKLNSKFKASKKYLVNLTVVLYRPITLCMHGKTTHDRTMIVLARSINNEK